MDIARDLQDHQMLDRDGQACGRIDDILIQWDANGARLGPLLSGGGFLLDQLGRIGDQQATREVVVFGLRDPNGYYLAFTEPATGAS